MIKRESDPVIPVILILFSIFLLGSLFLFKERMLFVDPCFVNFTILNTHEFVITEHRYGAFFTQLFPLIGAALHLPLQSILISYSASFYILFCGIILLLLFPLRQRGLAILMSFYFTLIVSDVYYWPNNEVHQGIAWIFLFFGLMLNNAKSRNDFWKYAIALVTVFLGIFSHFIVFLPLVFLWIYFVIDQKEWQLSRKTIIIFSGLLLSLLFIKYQLGKDGWYDGEKLQGITTINFQSVLQTFSSGQAKSIGQLFFTNYWLVILILIVGVISLIQAKKYVLLIWTLISLTGYFILTCITFPEAFGRNLRFYMESQWMAFAIIASAPFVFSFLPIIKLKYAALILTSIFLIRLGYIAASGSVFHNRYLALEYAVDTIHSSGQSKVVISSNKLLEDTFLMTWGLPVESLTLSILKGYNPPVTIKVIPESEFMMTSQDTFLSCFTKMDIRELNPHYFNIDTLKPYHHWTDSSILFDVQ
ncbi:MAG: hypothetical protein M3R25_11385 [Bacteroidota bacterium]|nr:hypothetical protein [Bacteroidota bacterium]